jgi:hypothetical protein
MFNLSGEDKVLSVIREQLGLMGGMMMQRLLRPKFLL